jgi:RHS repeat-associated protein
MTRTSLRAKALACTFLATAAVATPALAQSGPTYRNLDANGVDIVRGDYILAFTEGTIGSGASELALLRQVTQNGQQSQWDLINFQLTRPYSGGTETISIALGNIAESFTGSAGSYTSTTHNGGTLTNSSGYTYTARDGTQISFSDPSGNPQYGATNFCKDTTQTSCTLLPGTITAPDGKTVTLDWTINERCSRVINDDGSIDCQYDSRLNTVSNGYGYSLAFAYASNSGGLFGNPPPSTWYQRTGASFYNNVVSSSAQTSVSYAYPSSGVVNVTDTGGNVWQAGPGYIKRPGASSNTMQVTGTVGSSLTATKAGVSTSYSRSVSGSTATMTITNALSQTTTVVSDLNVGRPTSVTDANSHTTSFSYDSYGRLTRVTEPEGNYVQLTLDSRGNVTQTDSVPKAGSGLSTVTTTAAFPSSCASNVACNQPTSVTDARGNTTSYDWDTTTGQLNSVTYPAPTTGAVAPQTRYTYSVGTDGVSQAVAVSECQTGSSCAGTSDEVKTTIAYDANGNVTSKAVAAGDNSLSAASAMTYDPLGNLLTVDGPLSGTADTTRYRYNGARQLVGIVSPDPDGAGALKNRAVKGTYTNGLLTKVEQGTVNSQSDTDWAAFSSLQETDTSYDSNARPVTQSLVSGGTTYALTQTSYDGVGRVQCVAQRMNPTYYGSLPSDACTLGTTSTTYGADRIVKRSYDAAGQVTLVQTGYGVTGVQADEVATAYTNNGRVASVTDAEGNKTSYVYDGFDRLTQTLYPSSTKGSGTSNGADYEQLGYDAGSNISSRRTRANETIGYSYDALNRLTVKTVPTSASGATGYSVWYGYDLLGRTTYARFGSVTGTGVTNSFDALGRLASTGTNMDGTARSITYQYDLSGNRTSMAASTSYAMWFDYDGLGRVIDLREGTNVVARIGYDAAGRRSSLGLGDGGYVSSSVGYGYDGASRLASLTRDLGGTSAGQSLGFAYNPASQIVQATNSNGAYAWTRHYNVNRGYSANGLNQYTAAGAATFTYDGNGNLTSDGTNSYVYDAENRLVSASGGVTLSYDPAGRLWQVTGGAATTRFFYDGDRVIEEYDGAGNRVRLYAWGPGVDEPLIWYQLDGGPVYRFLHADHQGSIVAVADTGGNALAINAYDEYGIPGSANQGRYGYTGQAWLPELGMWYYKARIYSPTLGRFLQTDPVAYGDGMNLYRYVHSDPVNFVDASGLAELCLREKTGGYESDVGPVVILETVCYPMGVVTYVGGGNGIGGRASPAGPNAPTAPQPPKVNQPPKPFDCNDALKEPGKIKTKTLSVSAVGLIGWVASVGTWTNQSTGTHGTFLTIGLGAGLQGGGTLTLPTYTSLAALVGMSDGYSIGFSIPVGPIALGGSYVKSSNDSGSGSGNAFDVTSPGLPFLGGAATYTDTRISNCKRGANR